MPDLGQYAIEVLAAYGASIVVLGVLVIGTLRASRSAKARLAEREAQTNG